MASWRSASPVSSAVEPSGATTLPEPSLGQKKVVTHSCRASSGEAHSSAQYAPSSCWLRGEGDGDVGTGG